MHGHAVQSRRPSMAGSKLIRFSEEATVARGDGIESIRLTPQPLEGQDFVMGTTSFPPGTAIRLHSHNCVEQVTVLEGEAVVELNGREMAVRPYDTTQVPAGEQHRFINSGETAMRILWVYGSTEVTRTFADTGETVEQFHRQ
ncbi:MAG: cupin domain-containing protein [Acidimicrobiia bacterium]|nr:cupin domain-containing protein [Acidimicrobiia bacterium]